MSDSNDESDSNDSQRSEISFYNEDEDNRNNKLNFAMSNARSIAAKIPFLIDMFTELNLNLVLLTETWLRDGKTTTEELERLSFANGIGMVCKNRSGRGGGVAVAFRNDVCSFKKFPSWTAMGNGQ